jgi:hypothetical protein
VPVAQPAPEVVRQLPQCGGDLHPPQLTWLAAPGQVLAARVGGDGEPPRRRRQSRPGYLSHIVALPARQFLLMLVALGESYTYCVVIMVLPRRCLARAAQVRWPVRGFEPKGLSPAPDVTTQDHDPPGRTSPAHTRKAGRSCTVSVDGSPADCSALARSTSSRMCLYGVPVARVMPSSQVRLHEAYASK